MEPNYLHATPLPFEGRVLSPIERMTETLQLARDVVDRVATLRERLLGPYPVDAVKGLEKKVPGLLNDLAQDAGDTRERLLRALDNLDAIGRALP